MNLGLLRYASLKTSDLTAPILQDIAGAFGVTMDVTDGLTDEVVSLLRANDVDGLADIVSKKGLVEKLQKLLGRQASAIDDNLIVCPHCNEYINPQA